MVGMPSLDFGLGGLLRWEENGRVWESLGKGRVPCRGRPDWESRWNLGQSVGGPLYLRILTVISSGAVVVRGAPL